LDSHFSRDACLVIQAVIFDMDGLLLDSEPLYRAAWQRALRKFGYELTDKRYAQLAGRNREDGERMLSEEFGWSVPLDEFRPLCEQYEAEEFSRPIRKRPGVDELLAWLEERGIQKAVATSTECRRAVRYLTEADLIGRFCAVAAGNEVAHGKPAPDLFLLAAQRIGKPAAGCLVLEDAEPGIRAARAAGMRAFLVPDLIAPSDEVSRLADGVFASLSDVAARLREEFARK
jgi:HAD superfamily hydrolase (TIGR01509 family)